MTARAVTLALSVAGILSKPATAQCRSATNQNLPALYVTAYAAHNAGLGRDVRDSVRAMISRMIPPGSIRLLGECDVANATRTEPWDRSPSDSLWPDDDLRELATITHANAVVQFVIAAEEGNRVRFYGTIIRPHERAAPIGEVYAPDLRGAELAAARRIAFDSSLWREPRRSGTTSQPIGSEQTYFEFQVERQAMPLADNARPVYPPSPLATRTPGEVLAQFTVGIDGRIEMGTFKILKSTDPLFTEAVRAALATDRFSAAEVSGKKVKQLVQMPFQFNPERP